MVSAFLPHQVRKHIGLILKHTGTVRQTQTCHIAATHLFTIPGSCVFFLAQVERVSFGFEKWDSVLYATTNQCETIAC